jgi:hypothetical protein
MNHENQIETRACVVPGRRTPRALTGVLLAVALPACAELDTGAAEPPLASFAASSETTAQFGVAAWEVTEVGAGARVIGRGGAATRKVEVLVQPDDSSAGARARIEAVFPSHGVFEIDRTGRLDGAGSPYLVQLGAALYNDIGKGGTPIDPEPPGLGSITSALSPLLTSGQIYLPWSFVPYNGGTDVGGACGQWPRDHFTVYPAQNVASCSAHWTTDDPSDCRVHVLYSIAAFRVDTCNWFVYITP